MARSIAAALLCLALACPAWAAPALAQATSPYLRLHAEDGIDWQPWGEAAFERARRENKLIFVSVGYASCHWCHLMQRNTFADPRVVELLNRRYVAILVDREARPDVDAHVIDILEAMNGMSGWPANLILTPDQVPLFGYTYMTPEAKGGAPGLLTVAGELAASWAGGDAALAATADTIREQMAEMSRRLLAVGKSDGGDPRPAALAALEQRLDRQAGGFREHGQGRFFHVTALRFLLHEAVRGGDAELLALLGRTLDTMAAGAVRDQLGGLFHRYTVDREWRVPHFEVMLEDNAQLARLYLEAMQATGNRRYGEVARGILDALLASLPLPDGGFAGSLDAESGGGEGLYYTWSAEELSAALGERAEAFAAAWFDPLIGRADRRGVLRLRGAAERRSQIASAFAADFDVLRVRRAKRAPPRRDDKAVTAWNALAVSAFALAARQLDEPRYLAAAQRAMAAILAGDGTGRLVRYRYLGHPAGAAFAADYALSVEALIDLYQSDFDARHLDRAAALADEMLRLFQPAAGQPLRLAPVAREGSAGLPPRPALAEDSAPSANAAALSALRRLALYSGASSHESAAAALADGLAARLADDPAAMPALAQSWGFRLDEAREVVIVGRRGGADTRALLAEVQRHLLPGTVTALLDPAVDSREHADDWLLLAERPQLGGRATAYVCHRRACDLPVNRVAELESQLARGARRPAAAPGG